MKLWTWQEPEADPTVGNVDPRRPGSYYDLIRKFRPAFERLWKKLGTDQILWCFVDEEEARKPWKDRNLWSLDVPGDSILATIDPGVWEFILGSEAVPPHYDEVRRAWGNEAMQKGFTIAKYVEHKVKEYHGILPPGGDWWAELFLNRPNELGWSSKWLSRVIGRESVVSEVLLTRPVAASCAMRVEDI